MNERASLRRETGYSEYSGRCGSGSHPAQSQTRRLYHEFATAARQCPDAPAIVMDGEVLTYGDLNQEADKLAHRLRLAAAAPEKIVAIFVERNFGLLVSLLGVIKSGATALFIDPSLPAERIDLLLADASPFVLLTDREFTNTSSSLPSVIRLSDSTMDPEPISFEPSETLTENDTAYIIYTSGSTGKPKAAGVSHATLHNLITWQRTHSPLTTECRVLQFAPASFDVFYQEALYALTSGASLILVGEEIRQDPYSLLRMIKQERVSHLFLPVVALHSLAATAVRERVKLPYLKEVTTAGEQLIVTNSVVQFFSRQKGCRLTNQYGPSETHVVTSYTMTGPSEQWQKRPPIGVPIDNVHTYVLSSDLQSVPAGQKGELYLGGIAVGRGYLNRPDITEQRYIPSPKRSENCRILYRTGDIVRNLPDGSLEYLGRADQQVKVRGYRVEPGEIEAALTGHREIDDAIVIAEEDGFGSVQLAAFAASRTVSSAEARAFLRKLLPEYMVPSTITILDRFPVNQNGKADRLKLAALRQSQNCSVEVIGHEFSDDTEHSLARIWANLLPNRRFGRTDSFWDIGGHSILAVRLFAEIQHEFGKVLPVSTLLERSTIAALAEAIHSSSPAAAWSSLVPLRRTGTRRPIYLIHSIEGTVSYYRELVKYLGDDQPVWGIEARGVDGLEAPEDSVSEIAASYVEQITAADPAGPYILVGHSYGGMIAYEAAQQLVALGKQVRFLGLIDTYSPSYFKRRAEIDESGLWRSLIEEARIVSRLQGEHLPYYFKLRLSSACLKVGRWFARMLSVTPFWDHQTSESKAVQAAGEAALLRYAPAAYPGDAVCFTASLHLNSTLSDPRMEWPVRLIEVRSVPGDHRSMFKEPNAQRLAQELANAIDRAHRESRESDAAGCSR